MTEVRELRALAHRLLDTIERETALLRHADAAAIAALQPEKERLATAWRQSLERLRGGTDALDEASRQALREPAQRLARALAENERLLRATTTATDRVVAAIAAEVREQRACGVGYSQRRQAPAQRSAASGVTLDRKL
jgi:hypothetical protein